MSKWFGRGKKKKEASASGTNSSGDSSQPRVAIGDQMDGFKVTGKFEDKVVTNFQDDGKTKFYIGDKFKDVEAGSYSRDKKHNHVLVGQPQAVTATPKPVRIVGHVFIINQEFKGTNRYRVGSIYDVKRLKETFEGFGMTVIVRPDLKYAEIVDEVRVISQSDFSAEKLFVFVYMSHGREEGVVEAADQPFFLDGTIFEPILRNPTLSGIAKIFITVACRGGSRFAECDHTDSIAGNQTDGRLVSRINGCVYAKCLFSYSTYEGHASHRALDGTYFIKYLCENLNKVNADTKIYSVFGNVIEALSDEYKIQFPVIQSTMYDLSFNDLASTAN